MLLEARTKQKMQQATLHEFQNLLENVEGSQNLDFFEKLENIQDNLQKMEQTLTRLNAESDEYLRLHDETMKVVDPAKYK